MSRKCLGNASATSGWRHAYGRCASATACESQALSAPFSETCTPRAQSTRSRRARGATLRDPSTLGQGAEHSNPLPSALLPSLFMVFSSAASASLLSPAFLLLPLPFLLPVFSFCFVSPPSLLPFSLEEQGAWNLRRAYGSVRTARRRAPQHPSTRHREPSRRRLPLGSLSAAAPSPSDGQFLTNPSAPIVSTICLASSAHTQL
eukprot:6184532-Pleurochrysis_carterae.AAC.2